MVVEGRTGLRRLGAGLGVGLGAYAASLAVRAVHGIYLLGYQERRRFRPEGWSAIEDDGYRPT
jgi:F0F1-type ATP synthase membrane subunit c/vacuolar-type H+-ATPase subunit K